MTSTGRVLIVVSAFVSVAAGLTELGPDADPALHLVGAVLVGVGLLAWALVGPPRPCTAGSGALHACDGPGPSRSQPPPLPS